MEEKQNDLVHDFNPSGKSFKFTPKVALIFLVIILLGLGSGYALSKKSSPVAKLSGSNVTASNGSTLQKGTIYGSNDTSTFKDTAEGVLNVGGIDGEGAYHLVRPGGPSQDVYLTSSSLDLSKFVNQKVKVWGQTQKAQHAGWLMDVGRVEVE